MKGQSRLLVAIFCFAVVGVCTAGEKVYQDVCVVCHGADAQGQAALNSPALAGQSAAYLERQLINFSETKRGSHDGDVFGQQMVAIATSLNAEKKKSIAQYLATLPARSPSIAEGDLQRGKKYYQSYCGSCHGAQAQGNDLLNSPRLNILEQSYQLRQYQYFLDGLRGAHGDDKFGRQMAMIAGGLKDMDIVKDVIAYITSIESQD
jgi:cytochrome c553